MPCCPDYCESCKEHHTGMCPPHEVRTMGTTWMWKRIDHLEEVLASMQGLCELHRAEIVRLNDRLSEIARLQDDPELDGTDVALPAWWRGHAAGAAEFQNVVDKAHAPLLALLDPAMPEDLPGAVEYIIDHSNEGWMKVGALLAENRVLQAAVVEALNKCGHLVEERDALRKVTRISEEAVSWSMVKEMDRLREEKGELISVISECASWLTELACQCEQPEKANVVSIRAALTNAITSMLPGLEEEEPNVVAEVFPALPLEDADE